MKKAFDKLLMIVFVLLLCVTVNAEEAEYNGYIVKIKENTSSVLFENSSLFDAGLLSEISDSDCVELISDEIETVNTLNSDHMLVTVQSEEDLDFLIELGLVENYEPDYEMQLFGFDYENNSFYSNQEWVYDFINADFAFNSGITGNGVKVAVIDSGIYPHNDLEGNILEGYNYCSDMENYDPADTTDNLYHGTFVSGIIAAVCNDTGLVGLSHNVKLVPLKVADGMSFSLSNAVDALYDSVDIYDCDVINMSLGSSQDSTNLNNAVNYVISKGALVISAAGNGGDSGYFYPAAYSNVVSVANAKRAYDANNNATLVINSSSQVNNRVNITAPGTNVYSLRNTQSGIISGTGTSFACPVVSAAAALVKSVFPDINQAEFSTYLKFSADSSYITAEQGKKHWGDGLLDVENLIKTACASRKLDFYESDLYEFNGESFVYLTNLKNEPLEKCSVVLKSYDEFYEVSEMKIVSVPLEAFASKELNLNKLGFDSNSTYDIYRNYVAGDVDGNGVVTNKDAVRILQFIAGWDVECNEGAFDTNNDSKVSNKDAVRILQKIVGWDVELN